MEDTHVSYKKDPGTIPEQTKNATACATGSLCPCGNKRKACGCICQKMQEVFSAGSTGFSGTVFHTKKGCVK